VKTVQNSQRNKDCAGDIEPRGKREFKSFRGLDACSLLMAATVMAPSCIIEGTVHIRARDPVSEFCIFFCLVQRT
jgi:hypothetical protein